MCVLVVGFSSLVTHTHTHFSSRFGVITSLHDGSELVSHDPLQVTKAIDEAVVFFFFPIS